MKNRFHGVANSLSKVISKKNKTINKKFLYINLNIDSLIGFTLNYIKFKIYFFYHKLFFNNIYFIFPRSNSRLLNYFISNQEYEFYSYSDGLGDAIYSYNLAKSKYYKGHYANKLFYKNSIINIPLNNYLEDWIKNFSYKKNNVALFLLPNPHLPQKYISFLIDKYQMILNEKKFNYYIFCGEISFFKKLILEANNYTYLRKLHLCKNHFKIEEVYSGPSTAAISFFFLFNKKGNVNLFKPHDNDKGLMRVSKMISILDLVKNKIIQKK